MKKIFFLSVILCVLAAFETKAQQQGASLSFAETKYDFGEIREDGGKVSHNFNFTNTGSEPIIIQNVKASCGCTTPEYPREPIMPGQKAHIKVIYNPMNRPSKFNKSITVTPNKGNPIVLWIKGDVIPRTKTVEDHYPMLIGNVRLKTNNIAFARIKNTDVKKQKVEIVNVADKAIKLGVNSVPSHISIRINPEEVKPKGKATLEITYDADKKNDWDYVIDNFYLTIDGKPIRNKRIMVSATIQEDFSKFNKEKMSEAAKIEFVQTTFDFGEIKQGDKVEHEFKFKNTGKSKLLIRKTRASCGCTAIQTGDKEIDAGDEGTVKVVFNSRGKSGRQNKTITVITNDPKRPRIVLWIKGMVNTK